MPGIVTLIVTDGTLSEDVRHFISACQLFKCQSAGSINKALLLSK